MPSSKPLMTVEQVADLLQVRPRWIYDAVAHNRLPVVRVGHYLRFDHDEIERWIENGGEGWS